MQHKQKLELTWIGKNNQQEHSTTIKEKYGKSYGLKVSCLV